MVTRLIQSGDLAAARALDAAVLDELTADFGLPVHGITLAQAQDYLTNPDKRAIAYLTGGVLRGVLLADRDAIGWQIVRVVTQKSLTVAQRLTGFRDAARDAATRLVSAGFPNVIIYGDVRLDGRLDLHLKTIAAFTRTPIIEGYEAIPGALPDDPQQDRPIIRFVRYAATAAQVAASV